MPVLSLLALRSRPARWIWFALLGSIGGCIPKNGGPVAPVPESLHVPVASPTPYACGRLLPTDAEAVPAVLDRAYIGWRRLYVTGEGARGALRVRRPEDRDDSVSEGIAYGMLIAAYHGDRPIFDGLYEYAKRHFDGNGLMHWKINSEGRVAGGGAATDADEDMAIALIVAEKLWGGSYGADAHRMIDSILANEVEPGTNVIKPGDGWGGTAVTNPSYFDPAYYRIFAKYTGDQRWLAVIDRSYRLFESIAPHNRGTGLAPDWMNAGAGPAKGQSYDYKWDATRVPLRLARDAAWFCEPRAQKILDQINAFFIQQGPLTIGDGYKITGEKFSSVHAAAFIGPVAASALFSNDEAFRSTLWKDLVGRWGGGYYSNHLRHLSLLFVAGQMPNPLDITPPGSSQRVPDATPPNPPPGSLKEVPEATLPNPPMPPPSDAAADSQP